MNLSSYDVPRGTPAPVVRPAVLKALLTLLLGWELVACRADRVDGPRAEARASDPDAAFASASTAPAADSVTSVRPGRPADPLVAGLTGIAFRTYDGSGEVVHPDAVAFPEAWHGHRLWSVLTPYPSSASRFENPSVFASDDGDHWDVPVGTINPLAKTARGYLSDPDLVHEPQRDELWMYYREVESLRPGTKREQHVADHVWLTTSANGVRWSAPRLLVSDTGRFVVSPSVVRRDAQTWRMFEIDAGQAGCSARTTRVIERTSQDGIRWSAASASALAQPGYVAWHVDVQYITARGEYWALLAAYPAGKSCMSSSLFLLTSNDGVTWTAGAYPIFARGVSRQFGAAVYRSTFAYTSDDDVTLWLSGARVAVPARKKRGPTYAWSAAVVHTTVTALASRMRDPSSAPPPMTVTSSAGQVTTTDRVP